MPPPPEKVAFYVGPIPVHWYGIMIMLGVLLASWIAYREAKRRREDPDHVWQLFPWVLSAGILGARLGWVLPSFDSLPRDPMSIFGIELPWQFRIFAIMDGGLSIQGALVGGVLAVLIYSRRHQLSFFKWADIIVPGVALAQAVGRWGNYFNQEAFGRPTDLPWGIPIAVDRQRAVAGEDFGPDARFHPTFAYEMVWDLANFGLLMWLGRQRRIRLLEGDLLWFYLIFYSIGRFMIEEIRVDSATVSGLKVPQVVAVLTILIAWVMLIYRHRPGSQAREAGAHVASGRRGLRGPAANGSQATYTVRRVPAPSPDGKTGLDGGGGVATVGSESVESETQAQSQ